jgi:hypothetical protein
VVVLGPPANRRLSEEEPLLMHASGKLPPPSPPGEKAAARQDQAGQASTGDGAGDGRCNASPFEHNEVTRHS